MELKPGYKQTEVGVIPVSWTIAELQEVCREQITYGIVQCGPHVENGVPYIRVSDMNTPELDVSGMLRTSPAIAAKFSRSRVEEGDIVYALRGKIGEVRRVGPTVAGANLTQGTARLSPNNSVRTAYLLWALRSQRSLRQAEFGAKGSTFREITLADLRQIHLPIPSPAEQEAIAEALSDVDALIESLEQLIAKKRHLKQGAMQELLRPKDGWKETTLLDLANGKKELFDDGDWIEAKHITDIGVRLVQTGDIGVGQFVEKDVKKYIFENSFVSLHCKEIREGDLLICRLAEPAGRACVLPDIGDAKIVTSVDVVRSGAE